MSEMQRFLMDGTPVSLNRLCRDEPDWAASRILSLEHNQEELRRRCESRTAELAEIRRPGYSWLLHQRLLARQDRDESDKKRNRLQTAMEQIANQMGGCSTGGKPTCKEIARSALNPTGER